MRDSLIHPETRIGAVHLTVSDLERSLRFYGDVLGFQLLERQDQTATLAADGVTPLLALTGQPDARPKPARSTGLYHFAILVPTRLELARSLRHLADMHYPAQGAADHWVSEALYLADPDGNGIEIYRDRPRDEWPRRNGQVQMATDPLDVDGVLAELEQDTRPWDGLSPQTRIGHVHLQVADVNRAEDFYCGLLGFDRVTRYGSSALFVSAGGYHHHIGLNTWAVVGAPPPPPDAVGLRFFVIRLPDRAELERIARRLEASGVQTKEEAGGVLFHDPSGNGIAIRPQES